MLSSIAIGVVAILLFAPGSPAARKIKAVGRGLTRMMLAIWLAVFGGSIFVAWFRGYPDAMALSPAFAVLVFGCAAYFVRRRDASEVDDGTMAVEPIAAERPVFGRARSLSDAPPSDPALVQSWRTLVILAEGYESRIAVVRASCERYLALVKGDAWDGDLSEYAAFIRRNLPALVEACAAQWYVATATERERLTAELLESLEQIGAKADRLRERARKASESEFDVQRAHIARRTAPDPFASGISSI